MLRLLLVSLLCCEQSRSGAGSGLSAAPTRFSVPELHHVCLRCGAAAAPPVVWTHGDTAVPAATDGDGRRHLLLPDGGLCVLRLRPSDGGDYSCDGRPAAALQVLTGHDFTVGAGRTLLLPCDLSPKPRQRWFHLRRGGGKEAVLTRFGNGTVRVERRGGRHAFRFHALQIRRLQPGDAGEYRCNGELRGRVSVRTADPEVVSLQTDACSPVTSQRTDVESKKKKKKKRKKTTTHSALLFVAVISLGSMILLMSLLFVLLTSIKCKQKRTHTATNTQCDTELRTWTSNTPSEWEESDSCSPADDTIHYASLGRHNWSERAPPPAGPDPNRVIYSAVVTRAAGGPGP